MAGCRSASYELAQEAERHRVVLAVSLGPRVFDDTEEPSGPAREARLLVHTRRGTA
jgi:hypothetical protein